MSFLQSKKFYTKVIVLNFGMIAKNEKGQELCFGCAKPCTTYDEEYFCDCDHAKAYHAGRFEILKCEQALSEAQNVFIDLSQPSQIVRDYLYEEELKKLKQKFNK